MGDVYGRKRFFMAGLAVFTVASALSGLSTTTSQLIAARALQGVGAALLVPGTLSIISATFAGKDRGAAIGIWGAIAGLAIAIGPVVGGYLVEHVSWQSVFFINVPIGIVGLLLTAVVVPESKDESKSRRVDPPGLVTGIAAVLFLTYALIEGNARGWTDGLILGSFGLAAAFFVAFLTVEARRQSAMLPLRLFRNRTFSGANVTAAAMFFAMTGTVFFLTLYLQNVRGYSPARAGLRLFPFSVTILLVAPFAGKASDRSGSRGLMTAGAVLVALGLAMLLGADAGTSYSAVLLPSFLVMGSGWALALAPMTNAVMGSVEPRMAGIASAVTNTSREIGATMGVAAIGALVTSVFTRAFLARLVEAGMPAGEAARIVGRVGSEAAAGSAGGSAPPEVTGAVQGAFIHAIHMGIWAAIVAMAVAAVVSFMTVRSHVEPHADHATEERLRGEAHA